MPKKTIRKKIIKKKRMTIGMSKSKYKTLVNRKKNKKNISLRNKKKLDHALFVQYCKCLKKFKFSKKENIGYPICMNSIYKKRQFKPPKNASRICNEVFK